LIKYRRKSTWNFTLNQRFPEVMAACANAIRPEQKGTWITDQMIRAYLNFHQQGYAHSIECWSEGSLIGGMYGTYVAGVFSGESMFYREKNASKLCLLYLIEGLAQNGISWIDIQMLTPHLEALGAKTISRSSYLKWLDQAKAKASSLAFVGQKN
ncbi:MAG: leucyl/phenylalanyl-tRNA--protein transferase, partial [Bdellovibrionales bacterium]|nr:leucyl/phenylalanyl-tRNA--protein transferase [Bdellovibrionales bacterium]